MELRKKILTFRDLFDISPLNGSVPIHEMMRIGVVPDVFICTIIVNAYRRNNGVERAVRYVEEMPGLRFEVNVATYNSLINGYVSVGDVEGAKRVMVLMSEKGLELNVITYTLLVMGYCKLLKMNEAEMLEIIDGY